MPCPICSRPALPRAQNPAAPFCCPRCKQIDLGKWLSDAYRVPGTDGDSEGEGAAGGSEGAPARREERS